MYEGSNYHRLEGRTAIVTGAGAGIGRCTALRLAAEGARVALFDLNGEALAATAVEIGERAVYTAQFDLLDFEALKEAARKAEEALGSVDVLVASAGGSAGLRNALTDFKDSTKEMRDWVIGLNLNATMDLCHALLPGMIARRGGRMIFIASIAASCGIRQRADYSAAKAGLVACAKTLAMELGEFNICVNCISPGAIARQGRTWPGMTYLGPDGRMGQPEEVAALAAFLASDEAAFITGQDYVIDGGRTLGPKT